MGGLTLLILGAFAIMAFVLAILLFEWFMIRRITSPRTTVLNVGHNHNMKAGDVIRIGSEQALVVSVTDTSVTIEMKR